MLKNHTSESRYTRAVVFYGHSDSKLYHDKAHKQKVSKADLEEYTLDRIIVEDTGIQYRPVSIKVTSPADEVVIITNSSTTATAKTFKTEEPGK